MAQLTFDRSIGKFVQGETYEVENQTQIDYFINNSFAYEVIEAKDDCGCNDTAKEEEKVAEEVVEKPNKPTKK